MYLAFKERRQLSLSLFHPRWLLEEPYTLPESWKMAWTDSDNELSVLGQEQEPKAIIGEDRFRGRGEEMLKGIIFEAIQTLHNLPAGEAENFAVAIRDMVAQLIEKQQAIIARRAEQPLRMPDQLPKANVRQFPSSRKRALTGREAAEQKERDKSRAQRRAGTEAQNAYDEKQTIEAEMVAEAQLRTGERSNNEDSSYSSILSDPSSSESSNNENENGNKEPRRSGRARKRTTKIAEESQLQREQRQRRKQQRAQKGERKVRRQRRLSASQLLDGFNFP